MTVSWQHKIRQNSIKEDKKTINFNPENISINDFNFSYVNSENKNKCLEITNFIKKYEWLRKVPPRVTHRFIATYKEHLAGVILFSTPNSFTKSLKDLYDKESLITRGACISWSPKNLASALIMWSIKYMVHNTNYRIFTAYADPEANELGTIYQACNFNYLGNTFGARQVYFDENNPQRGWVSSRYFTKKSSYKRYLKNLDIPWRKEWEIGKYGIKWDIIPKTISFFMKQEQKKSM